jgi:branched-chain amino acid transport system permease protein
LEIIINGLLVSAIYCLVSYGLALLVGIGLVCDCGFGCYIVLAPYIMTQVMAFAGPQFGLIWGIIIGLAAVGIIGYLFHRFLISPLRPDTFAIMMMTIGIALAIQEIMIMVWGTSNINVPSLMDGITEILGVTVLNQQLLGAGIAVAVLILMTLFVHKTKFGIAMRAVSENPIAGAIVGVENRRIYELIGVSGAVIAGLAGIILTPVTGASPYAWLALGLIPWAVITVGGWGKLWTIVPAALIIGFAEVVTAFSMPGGAYLKRTIALGIMLLIIIFRPTGIAGLRGWGAY